MSTYIGTHVRRDDAPAPRSPRVSSWSWRFDLQGIGLFLLFAALTIGLTLVGCLGTSAPVAGG